MTKSASIHAIRADTQISHHTYDRFTAKPINGAIGAELEGIDLSKPMDTETLAQVRSALLNHLIIVFRDQELSSQHLVDLGRQFGELHINPFVKGVDGFPEIMPVASKENAEKQFTGLWHSDISWDETPSLGSLLYAKELPEFGGDTLFANMYLAFDSLSERMRNMLDGLRAVHTVFQNHSAKAEHADAPDAVTHPVIRTHPETGRKLLFVNEYFTSHIEGMSEPESASLLQYLYQHAARPDFNCRVRWQPGTLVFWDNRCTQHYATNDYLGQNRLMHRVTVIGDKPY